MLKFTPVFVMCFLWKNLQQDDTSCGLFCIEFSSSSKNKNYIECYACKQCWIEPWKKVYQSDNKSADETNALKVGGSYTQNFDNAVDVFDSIKVVKLDHYVFDS